MNYTIVGGSLPVVICRLSAGEVMLSEAGGRTWQKGDIVTENKAEGGLGKSLGRMLSGESLFMSRYIAKGSGEIAFASSFPGKIIAKDLSAGESIICQRSSFMASTADVKMSVHFQKKLGAGFFGGEGFVMQKITGPGTVFLELDGHCVAYDLTPGERVVCDTGVVALMDESCKMEIETVKGLGNMLFGGEGMFNTVITGPGMVYLQTMTISQLARLIIPFLPDKK